MVSSEYSVKDEAEKTKEAEEETKKRLAENEEHTEEAVLIDEMLKEAFGKSTIEELRENIGIGERHAYNEMGKVLRGLQQEFRETCAAKLRELYHRGIDAKNNAEDVGDRLEMVNSRLEKAGLLGQAAGGDVEQMRMNSGNIAAFLDELAESNKGLYEDSEDYLRRFAQQYADQGRA